MHLKFVVQCAVAASLFALCAFAHAKPSPASEARITSSIRAAARERLRPYFERQHVDFPPAQLSLVVLKQERRIKLFAPDHTGEWRFLLQYPIVAASGKPGPKLREGDHQVPEGIYRIRSLNPESKFYLALELDYPNAFDLRQARLDGRKNLGGDIMIHGKWVSTGCVAVGDSAAQDLYVLALETGLRNIQVILAPADLRSNTSVADRLTSGPAWQAALYDDLRREMQKLGSGGDSTSSLLLRYADAEVPPDVQIYNAVSGLLSVFGPLTPPEPKRRK